MGDCASRCEPLLERVGVLANDRTTERVGLLVLESPRVARSIAPGQFVHLRIAHAADFILRRPFSVHRVDGERLEILYQVVGRGTRALSEAVRGAEMDLIGPLGVGWRIPDQARHAFVVAGGLGAAPMGMLVEALSARGIAVTVAQGGASAERLVACDLFESLARRVIVTTDDGSAGTRGLVTTVTEGVFTTDRPDVAYACGPGVMQRIVAAQAAAAGVPCQVSLERLMACGIGACLSCVVTTLDGQKRACVDGPVFDAGSVVWDAADAPPHGGGVRDGR